jgi:hypothetical protein
MDKRAAFRQKLHMPVVRDRQRGFRALRLPSIWKVPALDFDLFESSVDHFGHFTFFCDKEKTSGFLRRRRAGSALPLEVRDRHSYFWSSLRTFLYLFARLNDIAHKIDAEAKMGPLALSDGAERLSDGAERQCQGRRGSIDQPRIE